MRPSIIALLAGSALLAACASGGGREPAAQPTNPLALTPTEQYGAAFTDGADEILLAATGGLSQNQAAALGELVMRWRDDGESGPIVVTAAAAGPAAGTAAAAAEALAGYGVPPGAVRRAQAEGAAPAPVRVGFATVVAVLPDCSTRWGELTRTRENKPHVGFGCAMASNMAAQTANPRDLVQPRAEGPADGERRVGVLGKYRQGQSTASQRGPDERGVVSSAVQ